MRKTIITLFLVLSAIVPCFAVAGPSQWSLAGVASWAQPLTASGTALPATATYAIGDFFALYDAAEASETFSIYRLCASGTDAVWLPSSGEAGGGTSTLIDAADLPSVTGNANKALALGTDTASFYWLDILGALTGHTGNSTSPHGNSLEQYSLNVTNGLTANTLTANNYYFPNSGYYGAVTLAMIGSDTVLDRQGYVVAASCSAELDTVVILAPASSTQAVGVVYSSAPNGDVLVQVAGECEVLVASDSETIAPGDWVITSDTTPGHVMRASSAGDVPLSSDELQRRLGYATYEEFQSGGATCTWIILKGTR